MFLSSRSVLEPRSRINGDFNIKPCQRVVYRITTTDLAPRAVQSSEINQGRQEVVGLTGLRRPPQHAVVLVGHGAWGRR